MIEFIPEPAVRFAELRFTAKEATDGACKGCLFGSCVSKVCYDACHAAVAAGLPDCDHVSPSGRSYIYAADDAGRGAIVTPVTKLTDEQVEEVMHAVWKREDLREHIRESLSNEAIAKKLGVNVCTVERVIRYVISKGKNG